MQKSRDQRHPERQNHAYRVGAAATRAGVGVQTLHYYEREGLIEPAARTAAGYRLYSDETVQRVCAIKRAQALGFSLLEIGELIGIARGGRSASEAATIAQQRVAEIDARIEQLATMRAALIGTIEACRCGGDLSRCDVLAGLAAESKAVEDPIERPTGETP